VFLFGRRAAILAIGDLGGAAIAMIDRDQALDVVELDRDREIVPERLVPIGEFWRDRADRRASDDELAVLADEAALHREVAHRRLHPWIDGAKDHRLVI